MGYLLDINSLCIPVEPSEEWLHYLQENYFYDEKGNLFKRGRANPVGYLDRDGYLVTRLGPIKGVTDRKKYFRVHHIIWYLGNDFIWPTQEINHKNHNRSDNRLENIEIIDRATNLKKRMRTQSDPF